jgi:hypothetical protein
MMPFRIRDQAGKHVAKLHPGHDYLIMGTGHLESANVFAL